MPPRHGPQVVPREGVPGQENTQSYWPIGGGVKHLIDVISLDQLFYLHPFFVRAVGAELERGRAVSCLSDFVYRPL